MGKRVIKPPDERKKEFMDAARALFIEQGYDRTTMSHIAERANVAQGTFYIYFSSKQDVLMAIMKEMLEALTEIIRQLAERTDLSAPAALRRALDECFAVVGREARLVETIYLQANYSLPSKVLELTTPTLLPIITSIIERGVREGSMKVTHPGIAADFLWTVGYRLFEMQALQQVMRGKSEAEGPAPLPVSDLQEAFWEFVGHGFGLSRVQG